MKLTFAFCYFMKFDPLVLKTAIPAHIAYWEEQAPESFTDGPFGDRSGGLIIFSSESLEAAEQVCRKDPYLAEGLILDYWVREWLVSRQR